ncbi:DNA polymerase III subunit delta [Croceicoccus sp. YJ47]|uniref:DNA polymerase III subunit delta n=1 Tax=Croceicoccus sp. YJ47 TaxID=2798724 RepID=UPI0019249A63|nr:DNA polymerase III subunit delta [Croceicoccus sp. YJ47]QQN72978.1 DNA polymerase III subunit delta [Croceicoccus sp. YJ47]
MKAKNSNFGQIAPRAAQAAKIFFFCGPDESGAHAAATRIVTLLGERAGERVEIGGAELRRDPVRLADETRSTSLFGDARHIVVRAQGEEALDALKILTESEAVADGWPVLILASGATDKSRSAKLLEKRDDALVAMFYPPDLRSVTTDVRQMADAAGLRMGSDLAQRIAGSVGLDTRMAGSEIAKLALYLDAAPEAPRTVEAADIDAIGAETEDDNLNPLVDAVLSGDLRRLPDELSRFVQLSLNPVGAVLAMERRASQLSTLSARMGNRPDAAAFVGQQPDVFFRDKPAIADQLARWRGPRLARLCTRLVDLHRQLLKDSAAAELNFRIACTNIARAAFQNRT